MSEFRIDVALTPSSLPESRLVGRQVAVIDVLRATTTMATAIANGARSIVPVSEPSQAVEVREKLGPEHVLLGGEREARKIDNFDLGNSPLEYTTDVVKDNVIVMCTTNGTQILTGRRFNGPVWMASFVNLSAVCQRIAADERDLVIICAGNQGSFSLEDTLCAGGVIDHLMDLTQKPLRLNDAGKIALVHYNANGDRLEESMRDSEHGRHLLELGFEEDLHYAAGIDSLEITPCFADGRVMKFAFDSSQAPTGKISEVGNS